MLLKVLGFFGINLSSLTGPLVWLVGITFIFGGAATWLREDAINDTNSRWELRLSQEALKAHNEVQEKQLQLERVQKVLALKEKDDEEKLQKDREIVEKQKVDFPLSPECARCRIPNERIWVRGGSGVAGKSQTSIAGKPPGS